MATDTRPASVPTRRPNPLLLVLLGLLVVIFLVLRLGGAASDPPGTSNVAGAVPQAAPAAVESGLLDVRLEALEEERPAPGASERNPFRFQTRAVSRAPAMPPQQAMRTETPEFGGPPPGPVTPPPPPITVRFIGLLDREDGSRMAVFVDCTVGRRTSHAVEGGIVDGRYRLVKVGLQSVVIEHLDGRGRTTLAQTGQDCVGR